MKNCKIHCRSVIPALLVALGLGCVFLSTAARAQSDNHSIVGLWKVHYFAGAVEIFQSFDQWHSDGQEFEAAALYPGAMCQGSFKQTASTVKLFHTGWNFDATGAPVGYFNETQTNTVDRGGNTYHGTWDIKNYDLNGNFVSEDSGTLTATRLTVNTPP